MSEYIEKIYSKQEPEKLLHIIVRHNAFYAANFRMDIVDVSRFLQIALLNLKENQEFKPHAHIYKEFNEKNYISNESWIVMNGSVLGYYYDINKELLTSIVLHKGDITITLENGGHTYKALENNTWCVEVKNGPYKNQEWDKVFI